MEESQIKLRRRADKVLPLQVLKFEFSSDRNGSQLVLGAENRIIFNASGVLAAHDDTVEVMHTAILFRRPGVYLVKMQYEHEFDDVEVHAHLPCDASTRRVVLQGRRDALRKHCFVRNSQNITLAVSTPGKSPKNGGFLSLFLEVAQLG